MNPAYKGPAPAKHPGRLEEPRVASEVGSLASESPSPISVHHIVTRPAAFQPPSPSISRTCPLTPPSLSPDMLGGGARSPNSDNREAEVPGAECGGSRSAQEQRPIQPTDGQICPAPQRGGSYSFTSSSVSASEGTDTRRCSAAAIENDGNANLAYEPVKAPRQDSTSDHESPTFAEEAGADQRGDASSQASAVCARLGRQLSQQNSSRGSFARLGEQQLPPNRPPPLLQEDATPAAPPSDTNAKATDANDAVAVSAPQVEVSKLDSVISMATSSEDEGGRATPNIDMFALAKRVGATPEQAKAKLASSLQSSHKPKHSSSGGGVVFAEAPQISLFDKLSYPPTDTSEPAPGDWRRRSSALAFEARKRLSGLENSLSPPRDPARRPSPPRSPGRIRSLSLSIGADMKCDILKQQQEEEEVGCRHASEEAKKAMRKQRWRRRTTVSHLTIPSPETALQESEGAAPVMQLHHSIKAGDAADAVGIRSSATQEAGPGGWKRRGSALAERAVFQQDTLWLLQRTPSPPRTPGRNRTLSLSIPPDMQRMSEEKQLRDERQEEVLTKLQAEQKEIQRQLQEQAEQYRQQMQQQHDLLEAILRQQRQLEEKERPADDHKADKRPPQEDADAKGSPPARNVASPTRQTLTSQQRQQIQEHMKQLEYLQQNRPRTSRPSLLTQEKGEKDDTGSPGLQRTPSGTSGTEMGSGSGRMPVEKAVNQYSVLDRIHRYLMEPNVLLLDVRSPQEFAVEKVAGSINVPTDQFLSCIHLLPKNKETPLMVYCSDGSRARQAAVALRKLGHANVCDAVSIKVVKHSLDGAVLKQMPSSVIGKALRRQLLSRSAQGTSSEDSPWCPPQGVRSRRPQHRSSSRDASSRRWTSVAEKRNGGGDARGARGGPPLAPVLDTPTTEALARLCSLQLHRPVDPRQVRAWSATFVGSVLLRIHNLRPTNGICFARWSQKASRESRHGGSCRSSFHEMDSLASVAQEPAASLRAVPGD
ncbi:rhodanese family domain-containing protein [Besnoitia besnoiti]|uniref:Rhodanese family domain-containing protein n=1 Tax=Besnoitia besnoiti TaxID=94643 RepID=A0A2A9M0Y3_BESBE|nr:rhodanese family domain-containing protein [Besnoitia besnoiti]PFH31619.1 rhodanese family domain-containing protein [Besnoitia besnoiti]